ncbi:MAG: hemolysin family protein [Muribaculaceae bacterium]|nr:hemolysin family protein [Muribaculaceae bacterium]
MTAIIITAIAILLSALFSGSEIAFVQSSKVRMEIDAARGGLTDRILRRFSRKEDMFISTLLVGNNVVLVIYGITFSIIINPLLERWLPGEALVLICNTVLSTAIILLAGEFLPKTAFRINPNFMMRLMALPLFLIYIVLYPVSKFISWISKGLMRLFGLSGGEDVHTLITMEQLDDYLEETISTSHDRKEVENEVKIFHNAIDFRDTQIGDCMKPRNEIVAVEIDSTTRQELISKFIATGLSKIVVFRGDIDDVAGYIHVAELFNPEGDWRDRIKPVIFTPETMLADKMMSRMLGEKRSLAIVIDEFGGTAGLVTLEDLVEEIFGEIEDEHDRSRSLVKQVADNVYEIAGRAEIESLNEEYGLDIRESDDYHTLAGFIIDHLGALPSDGETFEYGPLRFTVLRMSATRIELVRVEKV